MKWRQLYSTLNHLILQADINFCLISVTSTGFHCDQVVRYLFLTWLVGNQLLVSSIIAVSFSAHRSVKRIPVSSSLSFGTCSLFIEMKIMILSESSHTRTVNRLSKLALADWSTDWPQFGLTALPRILWCSNIIWPIHTPGSGWHQGASWWSYGSSHPEVGTWSHTRLRHEPETKMCNEG